MAIDLDVYNLIRSGRAGFYRQKRGLIAVWGKEAVQFLDGLVTNSVKTLEDGTSMLAAFPNAQGRLLAVVRVQRQGERLLFETEMATRETVFQTLFKFTFAGDFFVEDLSDEFEYFEMFGPKADIYHPNVAEKWPGAFVYELPYGAGYFMPNAIADDFTEFLKPVNDCQVIDDEMYETLRVEAGIPKYGVDMDDTTVVPEMGIDDLISYNKGCYIGQEIIARIHFRGHVAKQLTGIFLEGEKGGKGEGETGVLTTADGNAAGRITSVTYSPKLNKTIALAYVRYEHLAPGTVLRCGDAEVVVTAIPFI